MDFCKSATPKTKPFTKVFCVHHQILSVQIPNFFLTRNLVVWIKSYIIAVDFSVEFEGSCTGHRGCEKVVETDSKKTGQRGGDVVDAGKCKSSRNALIDAGQTLVYKTRAALTYSGILGLTLVHTTLTRHIACRTAEAFRNSQDFMPA